MTIHRPMAEFLAQLLALLKEHDVDRDVHEIRMLIDANDRREICVTLRERAPRPWDVVN